MNLSQKLRMLQGTKPSKEIAERANISPQYYSDLTYGRSYPSLQTVFWLAYAFEITPSDLLRDVDNQEIPAPVEYEPVLNFRPVRAEVCANCYYGQWRDQQFSCQREGGPVFSLHQAQDHRHYEATCDRFKHRE